MSVTVDANGEAAHNDVTPAEELTVPVGVTPVPVTVVVKVTDSPETVVRSLDVVTTPGVASATAGSALITIWASAPLNSSATDRRVTPRRPSF